MEGIKREWVSSSALSRDQTKEANKVRYHALGLLGKDTVYRFIDTAEVGYITANNVALKEAMEENKGAKEYKVVKRGGPWALTDGLGAQKWVGTELASAEASATRHDWLITAKVDSGKLKDNLTWDELDQDGPSRISWDNEGNGYGVLIGAGSDKDYGAAVSPWTESRAWMVVKSSTEKKNYAVMGKDDGGAAFNEATTEFSLQKWKA